MKWIGLTGGIASGKSAVSKILRDLGLPVVDADDLARRVVAADSPGLQAVVNAFGTGILNAEGGLDRTALGRLVFADAAKRLRLEGILHPLIQDLKHKAKLQLENEGAEYAFYDVPLLFEKNLEGDFDHTVLVYSSPEDQRRRLRERDSLSDEEISQRMQAQLPIDEKKVRADFVILNTGSMADLKHNVLQILTDLRD